MNKKDGYIALISVLIISLILITVIVNLSLISYLNNQNQFDRELKAQSYNAAVSCVDFIRPKIFLYQNYSPQNININLGNIGSCKIISILPPAGFPKTILAQGRYPPNSNYQSYTNLTAVIDANNNLISLAEN